MKRLGFLLIPSFVVLVAIGLVFWSDSATAVVSNADYSGMPPFISTIVTPNVLIMLDNSGSMGYRAVCDDTTNAASPYTACPTSPQMYPTGTPAGAPYIETVTFSGLFDSMSCYNYDRTNNRFLATTTKSLITSACGAADW